MDNNNQSNYDRYVTELNKRIKSDMLDIAPAEFIEHLREEIFMVRVAHWINTQDFKDQANSWDENQKRKKLIK